MDCGNLSALGTLDLLVFMIKDVEESISQWSPVLLFIWNAILDSYDLCIVVCYIYYGRMVGMSCSDVRDLYNVLTYENTPHLSVRMSRKVCVLVEGTIP